MYKNSKIDESDTVKRLVHIDIYDDILIFGAVDNYLECDGWRNVNRSRNLK